MKPAGTLRVGVLLDSDRKPQWVHAVLSSVEASPHADLVAVLRAPHPAPPPRGLRAKLASLWPQRSFFLYRVYTALDRRFFKRSWKGRPDAFASADLTHLLSDCRRLDLQVRSKRFSDWVDDASVEAVRELRLDVILRFGLRIVRGDILGAAKYGVWSYHHADSFVKRGGPPCLSEVLDGEPATGVMLQVLNEEIDGGQVLARAWTATDKTSTERCKNRLYWLGTRMVPRCLERLAEEGMEAFDDDDAENAFLPYSGHIHKKPTNGEIAPALVALAGRTARRKARRLVQRNQWFLAYRRTKEPTDAPSDQYFNFRHVVPPAHLDWADPFPIVHEGRDWIFFEEAPAGGKGRICVAEIDEKGRFGEVKKVLERPWHLSYPNVFTWNDEMWMLPESGRNRRLELYRAKRFPDAWESAEILFEDRVLVDPTLLEHDGRWWLFAGLGIEESGDNDDELGVFHAPSPLGPWQPVRRQPVKSDVRGARPAGRLFRWRGDLYRPGQDSSVRYGHSVIIHKVTRLDEDGYAEEACGRLEPKWAPGLIATHTLNHAGRLTTIDGMRATRRTL